MKLLLLLTAILLINQTTFSQTGIESDIESALVNAKKGIYWVLSNIPSKKAKIEKSLISDDKLIAKVKLSKELNGVRIESTGFFQSNEVTVVIYRSRESLLKDGYIKKNELEEYSEED